MTIKDINPSTEGVIAEYENMTKDEVIIKAKKAKDTLEEWKKDINKRTDLLHNFVRQLIKIRRASL